MPTDKISNGERQVLRDLLRRKQQLDHALHEFQDGQHRAANILRSIGDSVIVDDHELIADPLTRLVYSAEVQELEDLLAAKKQAELDAGIAQPDGEIINIDFRPLDLPAKPKRKAK